ncbi:MAG: helix-turn-helix transcriptional regulator, partial [Bdellovibrionales bacterium]|nr:helix-turn-helix transcriptional regulator [Bdellovibrionales bacterium]
MRKTQGLSLQQAAEKLNRSAGWLSEVENSRGRSTIDREEFERVIGLLNGDKHRDMFRTWISNQLNLERVDRTFDGAVLKHVRLKQELRLKEAAKKLGMSSS